MAEGRFMTVVFLRECNTQVGQPHYVNVKYEWSAADAFIALAPQAVGQEWTAYSLKAASVLSQKRVNEEAYTLGTILSDPERPMKQLLQSNDSFVGLVFNMKQIAREGARGPAAATGSQTADQLLQHPPQPPLTRASGQHVEAAANGASARLRETVEGAAAGPVDVRATCAPEMAEPRPQHPHQPPLTRASGQQVEAAADGASARLRQTVQGAETGAVEVGAAGAPEKQDKVCAKPATSSRTCPEGHDAISGADGASNTLKEEEQEAAEQPMDPQSEDEPILDTFHKSYNMKRKMQIGQSGKAGKKTKQGPKAKVLTDPEDDDRTVPEAQEQVKSVKRTARARNGPRQTAQRRQTARQGKQAKKTGKKTSEDVGSSSGRSNKRATQQPLELNKKARTADPKPRGRAGKLVQVGTIENKYSKAAPDTGRLQTTFSLFEVLRPLEEVYETLVVGLMAAGSPTLPLDLTTDAIAASVDEEWAGRDKSFQKKGVLAVLDLWRRSYLSNTEGLQNLGVLKLLIESTEVNSLETKLSSITATDGQGQLTEFVHSIFHKKATVATARWGEAALVKGRDAVDSFCKSVDTAVVDLFSGAADEGMKRTYTEHLVITMLEAGITWKKRAANREDLKRALRKGAATAAGDFGIPSVLSMVTNGNYNQFGCLLYGNQRTKRSFTM